MPVAGPAVTRRTLLLTAAAGAALVACGGRRAAAPATTTDEIALDQAVADERALLTAYDDLLGAAGANPDLQRARAAHAAHLTALTALLPASATPTGSPTPPSAGGIDSLRRAEAASASSLRTAALAVRDGTAAAVMASVAASHAARAETARR